MREINWNKNWKFWDDKDSFALVWDVPAEAIDVELPHDAMLLKAPHADSPNGNNTGFRDGGCYAYVKTFEADAAWQNKRVCVKFDGVYMNAMVYLNGQIVAKNPFGYTYFLAELTDYLYFDRPNELRVLVRTGNMTNSRWYSGSGIYRDVTLYVLPETHIEPLGVWVKTADIDNNYACLEVKAEINNCSIKPFDGKVDVVVTDSAGRKAAIDTTPLFMKGNSTIIHSIKLNIDNPGLWDTENPNLYCARVTIKCGDGVSDEVDKADVTFGIRTVSADARRGLLINGRETLLRGACIHHDNGILGAEEYYEASLRRVRKLKEAGFNAIRMSHQPASCALLKACDEVGLLVMDELSDMWDRPKSFYDFGLFFDEWWEDVLTAMIRNDRNHPSVIMYSIGNEIPEIGSPEGSLRAAEIAQKAKELDSSRLVTAGINGVFAAGDDVDRIVGDVAEGLSDDEKQGGNVNDFMTLMDSHMDEIVVHDAISRRLERACASLDVAGYNYMAARYEPDGKNYPNRVIAGSETYPPEIARNWELVKRLPHVIGDFTWTGWDYIGEAGVGIPAYKFGEGGFGAQYPAQLAYTGDLDITGFRRPQSYFKEIVFGLRKEPYIAVQNPSHYRENLIKTPWVLSDSISSWSFPGYEGKPVIVEVYAPGDEVELIINGVSKGKKPSGERTGYRCLFETEYEPGEITAVTYDSGKIISKFTLESCGEPHRIEIKKEPGYGDELAFFEVEIVDKEGRLVSHANPLLTLKADKSADIRIGSGDPKPMNNYVDRVTNPWYGRAQVIAKITGGKIPAFTIQTDDGLKAEYKE